jgi:hypothetical protein
MTESRWDILTQIQPVKQASNGLTMMLSEAAPGRLTQFANVVFVTSAANRYATFKVGAQFSPGRLSIQTDLFFLCPLFFGSFDLSKVDPAGNQLAD